MRITSRNQKPTQRGSILIPFFILMVVIATTIAGLGAYVAQSSSVARRRNEMIAATQYAQGGAVIAVSDLNTAVTNKTGTVAFNLKKDGATKYQKNGSLSTAAVDVYDRTVSSPFTNQTVTVQVWLSNSASATTAKIVAIAKTGGVTQTSTINVKFGTAFPAAIISVNPGNNNNGISKSQAQDGNVVISGSSKGVTVVDGGAGWAVLANGKVNLNTNYSDVDMASISQTNYNTANEIPDYTSQGTANALFDFDRFVAIADLTPNALNPRGNNHFTNMLTFQIAANKAVTNAAHALEGMIVVDVKGSDGARNDLDPQHYPNGINVEGTLFFKFDSSFGPLDKIVNTADMKVNPANLSGLVVTNPATYLSGYPPVYYDNTKNPTNIPINTLGFTKVSATEDLPALVYSIGVLDIHGNANISGVVYTPSNFEIENKQDNQIQYFKGTLISGLGCYFENGQDAISIISFDPEAVDSLMTMSATGKQVLVAYWQ